MTTIATSARRSARRPAAAVAGLTLLAALGLGACGYAPPADPAQTSAALEAQTTQEMQGMPGMSTGATSSAPTTVDPAATPRLPPADPVIGQRAGNVVTVDLTTERKDIEIAPGIVYHAWTFGGHVPGPVIRVTEGDTVHINVTNKDTMAHSIDLHAAQVPPDQDYGAIEPGATKSFTFTADHPGVFMYHCGSPMVMEHMANGMYGAIVVDPRAGRPAAREYVLVQSEFYTGAHAVQDMQSGSATYVTFNAYANHYKLAPLTAKPGELVRLYVVDAGPNHWSAFHVIGALFSSVQSDGNPANQTQWSQTASIPPGGAAVMELTMPQAGTYAFVSHSFADVGKGDLGAIAVSADAAAQPLLP